MRTPATNFRSILLLLLAALLLPQAAGAQKLKERMAQRYAEVFDYPRMAAVYEDIVTSGKGDVSDMRRLALAYKRMGEWGKAEQTYTRIMGTGSASPQDMWDYAEVLRNNGKYEEAMEWYANYAQGSPEDARAEAYVAHPGLLERLMRDSASARIRTLPINSPEADLAPTVMEELLLLSSARGEGVGGSHAYKWDDQPFLNLYSALLKGETADEVMVMRKDVNSRYHDGTASFDSLAQRLYFTRNNLHYGVLQKAEDGQLNLGIYFSDIVEGEFGNKEWGNLIPFDHNDPEFNTGHPSVSPDGRRLFFASDRPGGMGGVDIWVCDNLGNQWGAPYNLGAPVNTPGDEMYPHITPDSILYFASTGHPGLGGMDLFYSRLRPAGPGNPFNLGYPMNTRYNDHALVLINDSTGFFTSDRPGGQGSDDIYGCTIRPPMIYISGIVVDRDTREPIEGATILLKDEQGQHVKRFQLETEPGGKFKIDAEYHEKYQLLASKNGYFQNQMEIATDTDPLEDIVVELVKYDYAAEGLVLHGETEEPITGASVKLLDGDGNILEELMTADNGKYAFPLKPESDYRIVVEKEGFFKQSARISTKGKPSAVIYTDFKLFPLVVDQVVRLDNIYYDYNKADIRPDAALELDKLVQTLLDNPTVKIELSSHTDCRGGEGYNLKLSERRAKSAVDYLVSKGIPKDRVLSKGYGESKPSESCECTKCTDEEHQRNRRTEFKVLEK